MLVDGAKYGDVEIPVFCYEPKIGPPVGACRMCLVEIEGIPKLQTACSTPVKDGMVVVTTSRPREARAGGGRRVPPDQPPARLPGLRQGRRVPAAGHLVRLGRRPLAHDRAEAPLQEADRALAADRDRPRALHPLLPLRALLAGGRRGLPARLPRARRPHLRGHQRRRAVRRALQRQHRRAVPGGRADVDALPLPRAAVGHRGLGLDLRAVPQPVQHRVHGPRRRPHRAREGARQRGRRGRLALRQGPLRLPGGSLAGADHAAARLRGRRTARDQLGARALGSGRGAREGRRRDRGAGRRRDHQRGGLPAPEAPPRGARLAARRLAPERRARPGAGAHPRAPRPERAGVGHRERRRGARASTRTWSRRRRSSTCACARRVGARREARGGLEPPDLARRRTPTLSSASRRAARRPRCTTWRTTSRRSSAPAPSWSSGASGSRTATAAARASRRCSRSRAS